MSIASTESLQKLLSKSGKQVTDESAWYLIRRGKINGVLDIEMNMKFSWGVLDIKMNMKFSWGILDIEMNNEALLGVMMNE